LAQENPQGVLFVGAYPGARAIAHAVEDAGFRVVLVDNNHWHTRQARMEGLATHFGNILSEEAAAEINLGGIGRLIALTPNEEVNSLAAHEFRELFGRAEVYQLAAHPEETPRASTPPPHLRGRRAFGPEVTFELLQQRFAKGAVVKGTPLTEEFDYAAYLAQHDGKVIPLFVIDGKELKVVTADADVDPRPGEVVIGLVEG
jgi:hypothetical protein